MIKIHKSITKQIFLFGTFASLIITVLGVGYLGMNVSPNGEMSHCPFMGIATVCQMNPLEHIVAWQNMFTALPQKDIFTSLTFLLLIIFSFPLLRNFLPIPSKESLSAEAIRYKRKNILFIPTPLQRAFSDWLLPPKIF